MNILFYKIRGNFNYHLKISAFTVSMCLQDSCMQGWDLVCQRILNQTLSIWHGFLQPLFISRVKVGKSKGQTLVKLFGLFSNLISTANFERPISLFFLLHIYLRGGCKKFSHKSSLFIYIVGLFYTPKLKNQICPYFFFNFLPLK